MKFREEQFSDPDGRRSPAGKVANLPAVRNFRRHILELAQQVQRSGDFGPTAPSPAKRRTAPAPEIDCGSRHWTRSAFKDVLAKPL